MLLIISKKKIRQNAVYQPELVKDLNDAGDKKLYLLQEKKSDTRTFQSKVEEFKKENLSKINDSRLEIKKIIDFKSSGKLHGMKRDALCELVEKGKIETSVNSKPFYLKPPSEKLKELDEIIQSYNPYNPRNKVDDNVSKSSKRVGFKIQVDETKEAISARSGNFVINHQLKLIRKLKNISDKYSEHGTNDLSQSFSQSQVEINPQVIQPFGDLKKIIMQKKIRLDQTTAGPSISIKPVLTRSPTLNLPEPLGPKGKSARDIISDLRVSTEPDTLHKLKEKHLQLMEPQILPLRVNTKPFPTSIKAADKQKLKFSYRSSLKVEPQ